MVDYKEYQGWKEKDIKLHKKINWEKRNYEEYDTKGEFKGHIYVYGKRMYNPYKLYTFHKFIRPNAIYEPYWKAIDCDIEDVLGPMYDGEDFDGYGIHNRYETQDVYNAFCD